MFNEEEIIEFINRIINSPNIDDSEIKTNITKFYEYIVLTNMCDDETLKKVSTIIECLNEILALKKKIEYIDVNSLISKSNNPKNYQKIPNNRHFCHYESGGYSSSCGSSRTYSSHC
ncbi:MAG: hypothetical protein IKJ43_04265 [Bacilli bacterium]|nr:hypothetical protein [Bacilli bacterium]